MNVLFMKKSRKNRCNVDRGNGSLKIQMAPVHENVILRRDRVMSITRVELSIFVNQTSENIH